MDSAAIVLCGRLLSWLGLQGRQCDYVPYVTSTLFLSAVHVYTCTCMHMWYMYNIHVHVHVAYCEKESGTVY